MSEDEVGQFDQNEVAALAQSCKAGALLAARDGRYFTAGLLHGAAELAERLLGAVAAEGGEAPVAGEARPRRGRKSKAELEARQAGELQTAQASNDGTRLVQPADLAESSAATVTAALPGPAAAGFTTLAMAATK